jgi:predicted dehydrogenase
MNRRTFLKGIAQTSVSISAVSAWSAERARGANDRVNVALIGCGGRGNTVGKLMKAVAGVEFVALCDVYDAQFANTREWAGARCKMVKDFRRVLEMKDVDALLIATPDHWHGIPAVLACQAGKDIYLEKPLAYSVKEGRKVLDAVHNNNRVMQVGTQHRSAPHYAEAAEIVRSGALGKIRFVRIWNYVNMAPRGIGKAEDSDPPPGADWDFFLGPAPERKFNKNRFIKTYRWFWDYGGGLISDFGVHRFDSLHQIMGVDTPISVSATGGRYDLEDGCETPDFVQATYEYPGFVMSYEASMLNSLGIPGRTPGHNSYGARGEWDRPHGEAFYGSNGTLVSSRIGFEIFPEMEAPSGPGAVGAGAGVGRLKMERKVVASADRTDLHVKNFIECVRSRKTPVADVRIGHKSTIIAHLGNIAYRTGRKIKWDGGAEQIVDDPVVSRFLWREPRKKWDVI